MFKEVITVRSLEVQLQAGLRPPLSKPPAVERGVDMTGLVSRGCGVVHMAFSLHLGTVLLGKWRAEGPAAASTMNPADMRRSASGPAGAARIGFVGSGLLLCGRVRPGTAERSGVPHNAVERAPV